MTGTLYDDDRPYTGKPPSAVSEFEADLQCAASNTAPVLITAPPDVAVSAASRIHRNSANCGAAFLTVDCGRTKLPEQLEAVFECASPRGTIFLLNVDRLPAALQSLLFFRMAPLGVRIIAATAVNLLQAAAEGRFDERLFYRLNQIHVIAPYHNTPRGAA
jgi:DNA-binding NtrC family response regulator